MKSVIFFLNICCFFFLSLGKAQSVVKSRADMSEDLKNIFEKKIEDQADKLSSSRISFQEMLHNSSFLAPEMHQKYIELERQYPQICALSDIIAYSPVLEEVSDVKKGNIIVFLLDLVSITCPNFMSYEKDFIVNYFNEEKEETCNLLIKLNEIYFLFSASFLKNICSEDMGEYADLINLLTDSNFTDDFSFLAPPPSLNKKPFDIYNDVAQKMKKIDLNNRQHFPLFCRISALLLRKYLLTGSFIKNTKDLPIVNSLLQELSSAGSEKRCTYRWFLYFNKRMLMLDAAHRKHRSLSFNTNFDAFIQHVVTHLDIPILSNQDKFETFLFGFGNWNYRQRLSPNALSDLCPYIIMLPFPFELSAEELVKASTFIECAFWPLGFAFRSTIADGDTDMPPYIFEEHDVQHFGVLLNSNVILVKLITGDIVKFLENMKFSLLNVTKNMTSLRIKTFNQLQKIIYSIIQKEDNVLKKTIIYIFCVSYFS